MGIVLTTPLGHSQLVTTMFYLRMVEFDDEIISPLDTIEQKSKKKRKKTIRYYNQVKKQLSKLNSEISSTEIKISKLLDLHLDGKIDKIDYEDKYEELRSKLEVL